MRGRGLIPPVLAAVALAGCGSSGHGSTVVAVRDAAPPRATAPKASVKFNGPKVVHAGSSFKVSVSLEHFHIAPNMVGMAPMPGVGHLHFMLDGGKFDYPRYSGPQGKMAKKMGVAGQFSPSFTPNITYSHVPPGRYTLVCMLANNNHTPTGVEAKQTIIVR